MEPSAKPLRGAVAWCVGGFLFPALIGAIGFAFERRSPPTPEEEAQALSRPHVLSSVVTGLVVIHFVAATVLTLYFMTAAVRPLERIENALKAQGTQRSNETRIDLTVVRQWFKRQALAAPVPWGSLLAVVGVTVVQLFLSFCAGFLAGMAVTGE
jgi:hypothetical protein